MVERVSAPSADPADISADQFRTLADNLPQLAWIADANGNALWYNRRWFDYTGTDLARMGQVGWPSVIDPARLPAVQEGWQAALASGRQWEDILPLRGADGSYRQFLSRASPLRDAAGAIIQWFGTNTDITDQLAVE